MPGIYRYKCNRCRFKLPTGWGYCFYVEDDEGRRIPCYHPGEWETVSRVLGSRIPPLDVLLERTGFNSDCVCLDCLHQFEADLGEIGWSPFEWELYKQKPRSEQAKDKRECPKCGSPNVKTENEMVDQPCPRCKQGVIERIFTWVIS